MTHAVDIKSLNTIMQIQAMQTLGSGGVENPTGQSSSMFSSLFEEILKNFGAENGLGNNMLGSTTGLMENQNVMQQISAQAGGNSYLNSMLYKGDNNPYIPASLYATSQKNNVSASGLSQLTNPLNIGNTNVSAAGAMKYTGALAGANKYAGIIKKAADKYGLPEKLIASIMKQESNFNPNDVSYAGAQGLMQLMPGTARYVGVTNPFDIEQNIMGATKYISEMFRKHNNDPRIALAAYNAGPGNVQKYGGIPPFKETQDYVKKVLNYYQS